MLAFEVFDAFQATNMETQELMFFEIFVLLGFKPLEWWKNIMFKHDCLGWGRAPKPIQRLVGVRVGLGLGGDLVWGGVGLPNQLNPIMKKNQNPPPRLVPKSQPTSGMKGQV